jgi:hypothetical protein
MINNYIRVFTKLGSVLIDRSLAVQKSGDSFSFTASDELYIGQVVPFNNMFFQLTANDEVREVSVSVWNGHSWEPTVDIIDSTDGLKQDGVIQWTINRESVWAETEDTSLYQDMGLSSLKIYNLYWARITFTGASAVLKRIRYKFTDESQLNVIDPDLGRIMTAWDSNKTDWLEQILTASEIVALDLKGRKIIKNQGQIFRFDELYIPTAYKALSIIYAALDDEYTDKRDDARAMYHKLLGPQILSVDKNKDGHLSKHEISNAGGGVYR